MLDDRAPTRYLDDMVEYGPIMYWSVLTALWQARKVPDRRVCCYRFTRGCHIELDDSGKLISELVHNMETKTMPDTSFPRPNSLYAGDFDYFSTPYEKYFKQQIDLGRVTLSEFGPPTHAQLI